MESEVDTKEEGKWEKKNHVYYVQVGMRIDLKGEGGNKPAFEAKGSLESYTGTERRELDSVVEPQLEII